MSKSKSSYYLFKVEVKDINKNTLRTYYVYTIENNAERMKHFVSVQLEEYKSDVFYIDVTRLYEDDLHKINTRERIYNADVDWKYSWDLFNKIIDD